MTEPFQAFKISPNVFWVGAIDWNLRDFHGYATERGTSYNAYLILAEKITLIDTVKAPFKEEMLTRIKSIIDPSKIQYLVSNHAEMDHSGCLPQIISQLKPEKVFASPRGAQALKDHFHLEEPILPVKNGENVSLGNMNLSFVETPMLHWPDSMISFLDEDKVLFSQDAFGMHLASHKRYADETNPWILEFEAGKYFANILLPYSARILSLLEQFPKLNLPVEIIAPDHGSIWRKNWEYILNKYKKWALQKPEKKAVIVYDTMWGSTDIMARAIGEGLSKEGVDTRIMSLKGHHRSNVATEVLDTGVLIAGSPTINDQLFPTVADCLTYLKGLKPQNLTGGIFGSFGWNGKAIDQIGEYLNSMKIPFNSPVKAKYVPETEKLKECFMMGKEIAGELERKVNHE